MDRADVYTDLYGWSMIELMSKERGYAQMTDDRWIDGVVTASGCGAKPHTVPIE